VVKIPFGKKTIEFPYSPSKLFDKLEAEAANNKLLHPNFKSYTIHASVGTGGGTFERIQLVVDNKVVLTLERDKITKEVSVKLYSSGKWESTL